MKVMDTTPPIQPIRTHRVLGTGLGHDFNQSYQRAMATLVSRLIVRGPLPLREVRMVLGWLGRETIDSYLDWAKESFLIHEDDDGMIWPLCLAVDPQAPGDAIVAIYPAKIPNGSPAPLQSPSHQQRDL